MKFFLRCIVCGLFLLSAPWAWSESEPPVASQELDHIVAVVNSDVIMQSELNTKTNIIRRRLLESDTPPPPRQVLERQVLDRMILEQLQTQLARQQGIRVDDEALNDNLRRLARRNNMTLSQFRGVLAQDGFDYEQFREDVRSEIILSQLRRQMVENRIDVSALEVEHELQNREFDKELKEYRLEHILIAVPEAAASDQIQAQQQKALSIVERLRGGAGFRHIAVAESDGQNALEGGDLGWRTGVQLPTLFADKIIAMQPGDISDPMRSPSGFHIVRLVDVRGERRHVTHQLKVRHILLRPDELTSQAEVRSRLSQLWQRIEGGEDFAMLARAHSQDSVSAANGGDLGWVSPGDMVPQFEEAVFELPAGELSKPFETRFGWHIAQVLDKRDYDSTETFKRSQARESIRKRKVEEEMQLWLRRLRDEAYVEYRISE
ncbi:MAG: peptidylprolyl isomerase [Gammaproteobacteria bacterium]